MNTIIWMIDWTEVHVLEKKEEIKEKIKQKIWQEKTPYKWDNLYFIEVKVNSIFYKNWDRKHFDDWINYKNISINYKNISFYY